MLSLIFGTRGKLKHYGQANTVIMATFVLTNSSLTGKDNDKVSGYNSKKMVPHSDNNFGAWNDGLWKRCS
ncbi:hypothetical protein GCM10010916_04940 [Paenibacillus abyssi]|uniref:Uncharacterized protein n=1 Tax=Paenibacillus abyssi TaxID=1340531 RepID=A0A917CKJ9_9BACL|nr:hypothetical protein GCM10010916_04940 [Paenibacillus abyssi]